MKRENGVMKAMGQAETKGLIGLVAATATCISAAMNAGNVSKEEE